MTQSRWPSPAMDYEEKTLDLNKYIVKNPPATFFFRAQGHGMLGAGIFNNDLLVVDRSLTPSTGKIVVAAVNGEYMVRRMKKRGDRMYLIAEERGFAEHDITDSPDVTIFGVVAHVIHTFSY